MRFSVTKYFQSVKICPLIPCHSSTRMLTKDANRGVISSLYVFVVLRQQEFKPTLENSIHALYFAQLLNEIS